MTKLKIPKSKIRIKNTGKTLGNLIFNENFQKLLKVGIVALNYIKKFIFKMVIGSETELSIKFKTTESVFLFWFVCHAWFLERTDFGLKYFGLIMEFSCTGL